MTQPMHKQLRAIGELLKLDCGDNSCLAVAEKRGMRTNGGCRCDFVGAVAELLKRTENSEGALGSWILDERNELHARIYELQDELAKIKLAT